MSHCVPSRVYSCRTLSVLIIVIESGSTITRIKHLVKMNEYIIDSETGNSETRSLFCFPGTPPSVTTKKKTHSTHTNKMSCEENKSCTCCRTPDNAESEQQNSQSPSSASVISLALMGTNILFHQPKALRQTKLILVLSGEQICFFKLVGSILGEFCVTVKTTQSCFISVEKARRVSRAIL